MAADIKDQITKVVDKVTKDEKLMDQFKKDPVKAVESVLGVDLAVSVTGIAGPTLINHA